MQIFKLNQDYSIVCESVSTRYGFRHDAFLMRNGSEIDKAKCCYYNRTWESFCFESVINKLLTAHFKNKAIHSIESFKEILTLEAI